MNQKSYSPYRGYAVFMIPGIIVFLVFIIIPFLVNVGASFTRWTGIGTPEIIGFANYTKAFGDSVFWASFRNNLYLIIGMTTIPTLIGLFLAVVLFDYVAKRFGQTIASIFRAGFYLPQIIPVVMAALVWRWIYQPDWGALNQFLNIFGIKSQNWLGSPGTALASVMGMLIWFQIGYPLVIFMSGLQRIDPELYEAAAIDGATWFQKIMYMTIPLLRPEIYVVILTTMINSLKTFAPIYAMTRGGPGSSTIVASYFSYKNFFENSNVGYGSTMATVLTIVVALITVLYVRVQSQQEYRESL